MPEFILHLLLFSWLTAVLIHTPMVRRFKRSKDGLGGS
jgi:hypothetical protein